MRVRRVRGGLKNSILEILGQMPKRDVAERWSDLRRMAVWQTIDVGAATARNDALKAPVKRLSAPGQVSFRAVRNTPNNNVH